jgi:hypothetical protein
LVFDGIDFIFGGGEKTEFEGMEIFMEFVGEVVVVIGWMMVERVMEGISYGGLEEFVTFSIEIVLDTIQYLENENDFLVFVGEVVGIEVIGDYGGFGMNIGLICWLLVGGGCPIDFLEVVLLF